MAAKKGTKGVKNKKTKGDNEESKTIKILEDQRLHGFDGEALIQEEQRLATVGADALLRDNIEDPNHPLFAFTEKPLKEQQFLAYGANYIIQDDENCQGATKILEGQRAFSSGEMCIMLGGGIPAFQGYDKPWAVYGVSPGPKMDAAILKIHAMYIYKDIPYKEGEAKEGFTTLSYFSLKTDFWKYICEYENPDILHKYIRRLYDAWLKAQLKIEQEVELNNEADELDEKEEEITSLEKEYLRRIKADPDGVKVILDGQLSLEKEEASHDSEVGYKFKHNQKAVEYLEDKPGMTNRTKIERYANLINYNRDN